MDLSEHYISIFLNVLTLSFTLLKNYFFHRNVPHHVIVQNATVSFHLPPLYLRPTKSSIWEFTLTPFPVAIKTYPIGSHRLSQPLNLLKPLLGHKSVPPSWKLAVYRSVVQPILMYAMESAQLSSSQLTRINHVHFKAIRKTIWHKVILFTTEFLIPPFPNALTNTCLDWHMTHSG